MAIKLVIEVMDWAPPLTHREHKVLMILAENARLPSRESWDSVESPKILHRARLTQREMYAVIAALVRKRCLEKPVWGGRNHRAKYRIAHLAPQPLTAAGRQVMLYGIAAPATKISMRKNRTLRTKISMRIYSRLSDQDQHAQKQHPDSL